MRKTVICLLITAVLVFGMLTGTVSAAWAGSRSGITWEMQGTTLVISGSGEIEDYSGVKAPWEGKKNVTTSLVHHAAAVGNAHGHEYEKGGVAHAAAKGGQRRGVYEVAHDDAVHGGIKLLQQTSQHYRQGEEEYAPPLCSLCQVVLSHMRSFF